jgi:hypothetical protein
MNFSNGALKIWAIVGPLLGLLLGPGFIGEWRKTDIEKGRLDIERARASYELRQKMTPLLLEIIKIPQKTPERLAKERDFNAAEQNLARIEGRTPIVYDFRPVAPPRNVRVTPTPTPVP